MYIARTNNNAEAMNSMFLRQLQRKPHTLTEMVLALHKIMERHRVDVIRAITNRDSHFQLIPELEHQAIDLYDWERMSERTKENRIASIFAAQTRPLRRPKQPDISTHEYVTTTAPKGRKRKPGAKRNVFSRGTESRGRSGGNKEGQGPGPLG